MLLLLQLLLLLLVVGLKQWQLHAGEHLLIFFLRSDWKIEGERREGREKEEREDLPYSVEELARNEGFESSTGGALTKIGIKSGVLFVA